MSSRLNEVHTLQAAELPRSYFLTRTAHAHPRSLGTPILMFSTLLIDTRRQKEYAEEEVARMATVVAVQPR